MDLPNYQQFDEAQSHNNGQNLEGSNVPKSQAQGSLLFQLESPKNNDSQPHAKQETSKERKPDPKQKIQAKANTVDPQFNYEIELVSEKSEQEHQVNKTIEKQTETIPSKRSQNNKETNSTKQIDKQTEPVQKDIRQDRMKRRKNKGSHKDILNGSQTNYESTNFKHETLKKSQTKNIEYGKAQQHQNQRTDIPLKEQALTVNQRLEVLKEEVANQNKKAVKLPPLKRLKSKPQPQEINFAYNDSSIMALDKFPQPKNNNQNLVQSSFQSAVLNNFAFKPVPHGGYLKFIFKREKTCMQNYYHPQYSLIFNQNKLVFSARKEWGHINSHYNISCEQKNYQKQGKYYAGFLKGNFTGTLFNLYSYRNQTSEVVATVVYKAELNCIQPSFRKFQIYVKSEEYAQNELAGYQQDEDRDLQELYEIQDNARAKRIIKLVNKRPEWSQALNVFTMNFKGKLKMASVKNMILVEEGNQNRNVLMLCKDSQNEFYLQIASPINPFMAIGIVLTSFDFKLFCQ